MRVAVVGHVEWVTFLQVDHLPQVGEIVHAREGWEQPGGGGAGAAVQLAKLAGEAEFFTALGDDDLNLRARTILEGQGVTVHAAERQEPTRRAITHVDDAGERTITVVGSRLEPLGSDDLPWERLAGADAVYLTAGDSGALRSARAARTLTATSRVLPFLKGTGVALDALVGSAADPMELYTRGDLEPEPRLVVRTDGLRGGTFVAAGTDPVPYPPVPAPGPVVDNYGAGDSFAAGLAYALGVGQEPEEAVAFAARCGAHAVTGRGPYAGQLRL
jgi:ribokinase